MAGKDSVENNQQNNDRVRLSEEKQKAIKEQTILNNRDFSSKSKEQLDREIRDLPNQTNRNIEMLKSARNNILNNPDNELLYDPDERIRKRLGSFSAAQNNPVDEDEEEDIKSTDENETEDDLSNEGEIDENNDTEESIKDAAKDTAKQAVKTAVANKTKELTAQAGRSVLAFLTKNPYVLLVIAIIIVIIILLIILFGAATNYKNGKYDDVCNYNLTSVELNKCDTEETKTYDIDQYVINSAYKISATRNMSDESLKALMIILKTNALAEGNYDNASKKVSINDCNIKDLYTTDSDYSFKSNTSSKTRSFDVENADSSTSNEKWLWPIPNGDGRISSYFGPRKAPGPGASTNHGAIDIGIAKGTNVLATLSGTVSHVVTGCVEGNRSCGGKCGNYININHDNGMLSQYCHLSAVEVTNGQKVTQGQVIGKVGNTGNSFGAHLHFAIKKDGTRVDPLNYVSKDNSGAGVVVSNDSDDSTNSNDKMSSLYSSIEAETYLRSSYSGTITSLSESDALNIDESVLNEINNGSGSYTEILSSIYNNGDVAETEENEQSQKQIQQQTTNTSSNKGKVLLIAGHSYNSTCNGISNYCNHTTAGGKTSTGKSQPSECRGPAKASGYAEEKETRDFVKSIKSALENNGIGVDYANQLLSDDGSDCASFRNERVNNTSRFSKINWKQYAYVMEIHFNAANGSATGTMTCYSPGYKHLSIDSKIISAVTKNTGHASGNCQQQSSGLDDYKFFIDKGIPMTYLETEFYDNSSAMKNFLGKRTQIAKDIADVIKNNYGDALASGGFSASGEYKIYSLDDHCIAGDENGSSSSSYCGGISLTNTTLSKSDFVNGLRNAWGNGNSHQKTFASKAEDIYDISVKNNFNPELIPIRAQIEGFSPGRNGNYYGIGCTNRGGGKDCKSYSSFDDGVLGYINTVKKYGVTNLFDVYYVKHYAYIGDKWYKGGSGSGGCYYFPYIKQYYNDTNRATEVEKACHSGNAIKTNDADQYAYSGFQVEKSAKVRQTLFGLSTSGDYECSNMSSTGVVQDGSLGAQVAEYAVKTFDSFGYSQGNRLGSNQVDCSSMVYRAYKQFNVDISMNGDSTSEGELIACIKKEKIIQENELKPGDLIFYANSRGKRLGRKYGIGHVEMYIGDGKKFGAHTAKRDKDLQVSVTNFKPGEGSYYCRPY